MAKFFDLILTATATKIMYRHDIVKKSETHQLCFFIGIQSEEGSALSCTAHSQHKLALLHLVCLSLLEHSHMDHWK